MEEQQWNVTWPSGLIWQAHHTWTDNHTDRVDGFFLFPDGRRKQLDIASHGDECCTRLELATSKLEWDRGTVFLSTDHEAHGVDTLVVPVPSLTTELIHEALWRFRP